MAMEKMKELMAEVQKFERDRRKPSEKLEEGMIGSKQLHNISAVVGVIACILFVILWVKYSFFTALIGFVLIVVGERFFFFKSLMNNKRIREASSRNEQKEKTVIAKTNAVLATRKDLESKTEEGSKQKLMPKMGSKKTFDPSKVIVKE